VGALYKGDSLGSCRRNNIADAIRSHREKNRSLSVGALYKGDSLGSCRQNNIADTIPLPQRKKP
jgi:hypothetical protein